MEKNKKKTLTISGGIGKKISPPQTGKKPEKKAFNLNKKNPQGSFFKKPGQGFSKPTDKPSSRKNFSRKYAEQQATKRFIHSDSKDSPKTKFSKSEKTKDSVSKREAKLTISRAMKVE